MLLQFYLRTPHFFCLFLVKMWRWLWGFILRMTRPINSCISNLKFFRNQTGVRVKMSAVSAQQGGPLQWCLVLLWLFLVGEFKHSLTLYSHSDPNGITLVIVNKIHTHWLNFLFALATRIEPHVSTYWFPPGLVRFYVHFCGYYNFVLS